MGISMTYWDRYGNRCLLLLLICRCIFCANSCNVRCSLFEAFLERREMRFFNLWAFMSVVDCGQIKRKRGEGNFFFVMVLFGE